MQKVSIFDVRQGSKYTTTIHVLTKTNNQTLFAKASKITNFTKMKHTLAHTTPSAFSKKLIN